MKNRALLLIGLSALTLIGLASGVAAGAAASSRQRPCPMRFARRLPATRMFWRPRLMDTACSTGA